MARLLRVELPSALYYVTSRGNGRAAIYLPDGDREAFLTILDAVLPAAVMAVLCILLDDQPLSPGH